MSAMVKPVPEFLANPVDVPDGETRCFGFGNVDLWLQRSESEWSAAIIYKSDREDRPTELTDSPAPEDANWTRWVTGEMTKGVSLRPNMPDRAVVVRPESPVSLLPGQTTDFFIGVPLWIQVYAQELESILTETPSVRLSNTWFGEPAQGELCYALRTRAHVDPGRLIRRLHRAVCPVQVRNSASQTLTFERICLRCPHLSLFFLDGRIWANVTRLTHRGQNEWSRVIYAPTPPTELGEAILLAGPRVEVKRGFLGRSLNIALGPQL